MKWALIIILKVTMSFPPFLFFFFPHSLDSHEGSVGSITNLI